MGLFKGLQSFGTGVLQGASETLPGLMEGQRRSAELQEERNFQLELQNQKQDYTSEQALLDRIERIKTVNEAQTLMGSAYIAGNSGAQIALQGRIDAIGRERELAKEFRTETDERQRGLATFTQGLANTAQQGRENRTQKRLEIAQNRASVHQTVQSIMGNRAMVSLDARYELAKDAADGFPGLTKHLNLLQSQRIEYMATPPGSRITALDAFDLARNIVGEPKWTTGMTESDRMNALADMMMKMGVDNPAASRNRSASDGLVAKTIKEGTAITRGEFISRWTIAAGTGGPGWDTSSRDAAIAKLVDAKLILGEEAAPATPPEPFFKGPPGSASAKMGGIAESVGGAAKWIGEGIEATGGMGRERPSAGILGRYGRQTGRAGRIGGSPEDRTQRR